MKKEYLFPGNFSLTANENGTYSAFDLSVAVALVLGAKLEAITADGDALLETAPGEKAFVTTAVDMPTLSEKGKAYGANWFCPFTSKPIAQELMRRFPMMLTGQAFRYGALAAEWVAESNTVYAAGSPQTAGLQHGRDAWCLTASENALEAITLNALMQAGCNRMAAFYFPAGQDSATLIYVTPETAQAITGDANLSAMCVFTPSLVKSAVIGAPDGEHEFELENAKLQWQIQIARWSRETGQPVPTFEAAEEEQAEEAEAQNDK